MDTDAMRGAWHFTGTYWMCDCYGGGPLLNVHVGQGGPMRKGKPQSINTSRCYRCGVLRPLKRDKPELSDALPHGAERIDPSDVPDFMVWVNEER